MRSSRFRAPSLRGKYGPIGIVLVVLSLFPLFFHNRVLASEILIYGLYGLALDILFGHLGVLSLGHAAFFGLGAYGATAVSYYFRVPIIPALAAGVVLSAAGAVIIGYFALQLRGVGFIIVTLAMAQILYFSSSQIPFLHCEDGLTAYRSNLNLGFYTVDLGSSLNFYYLVLFFFIGSFLFFRKIFNSPFGSVLHCIRENENRARTIGYPVFRYMFIAFIISGAFSGLAGALFSMLMKFADMSYLDWNKSGQAVWVTLIGGKASLYGPLIGSFLMCTIEDIGPKYWMNWPIILGVTFVVCVLFLRGGIWSALERLVTNFWRDEDI
jgi:branched-chain amino acid transport system permease protein